MKKFSLFFLVLLIGGIFWSIFFPESGVLTDISSTLAPPSWHSWMGRDSLGRDLLNRIFQGAQVSVGLGLSSSIFSLIIGFLFGSCAALGPRKLDAVMMRFTEVLMALPSLMVMAVLALLLQTQGSGSHLWVLFWTLTLGSWMPVSKLTRNLILQEKSRDYIEAAQAIGVSPSRILLRHLFPNIVSSLLTYWSLQVPHAILAEGLLSFLGFGVRSPGVSWGALLQEGWKTLASYPHLLLGPSLFLFLTVLSLNILLEDFRKNLDPKLKWEKFS
jgi:oligopeptide transport system permease protein